MVNTFRNLSIKEESARRRAMDERARHSLMFKQYQTVRYFIRDIDTLGNNVNSIADMRSKLDAFIAQWGHSNYSRNLQAYITEALEVAPDKALYNRDGSKKNSVIMNGKTYTVQFSKMFYGTERVNLPAEQSVTYVDAETGKKWHWQAIAYVDRKSETDFVGRIYRTTYLNGEFYSASNYRFDRRMDVMHEVYSDPSQVVRSFIAYTETLTKGLNQE